MDALTLIRLPRVMDRVGYRKSQLYDMVRRGDFPAPVKIGARAVAWDAAAVDAWIRDRIAGAKS
jgi:prophage regulatory protein